MTMITTDWRPLDHGLATWFSTPSPTAGAELVRRIAAVTESAGLPDLELRAQGVRIRIGATEPDLAEAVSLAARDLGLVGDPSGLSSLRLAVAAADPEAVRAFWRTALDYHPDGTGLVDIGLADPSRRDPSVDFEKLTEPRPLRNRIHTDVVRDPEAVTAVLAELDREPYGPFGVAIADPEGNELDLVPGDRLPPGPDTSDWRVLFGALTYYPVTSAALAADLAAAVVSLATDAGIPLLLDLRRDGVTIDSGKDQWEADPARFAELAGRVQAEARRLGLVADPTRLRFVQFGIDAVDIPSVQAFWAATLGYEHDQREWLSDLYDPRRLAPVIFFQSLDPADRDRRRQRNRVRFELSVPPDQAAGRVATAVAAGGRLVITEGDRHTVADPEDNELIIVARRGSGS